LGGILACEAAFQPPPRWRYLSIHSPTIIIFYLSLQQLSNFSPNAANARILLWSSKRLAARKFYE
jgi:hypothetical protein